MSPPLGDHIVYSEEDSDAELPPVDQTDDGPDEVTLEQIITSFLDVNPTPTDEQVHSLASVLGIGYEELEETIYGMLSKYIGDDSETHTMQDAISWLTLRDEPDYDPVDDLLLKFFVRHPDPSDEQVHQLASLIGLSPEELEEHLYAMLSDLQDQDEDEDDDNVEFDLDGLVDDPADTAAPEPIEDVGLDSTNTPVRDVTLAEDENVFGPEVNS